MSGRRGRVLGMVCDVSQSPHFSQKTREMGHPAQDDNLRFYFRFTSDFESQFGGIHARDFRRFSHFVLSFALALAGVVSGRRWLRLLRLIMERIRRAAMAKPYVILVSLDGFRYDYAKRYHAEHLLALGAEGASAPEGMLPSYPSITFPNHYTIVTGLYPEHHGIVANNFYDPARKETYSYHDSKAVGDGTWYGGTPLWVLAEQAGMRSASFFWVGSEADIQGVRPSYYLKFDGSFPNPKRVEQVLAWLHLPAEQRPHLITLYFSDTDSAGHRFGPDSPQEADAVHELDGEIGKLMEGIKDSKLPVDLIVLADHGMVRSKVRQ